MINVAWIEDSDLSFAALVIRDDETGDTIEVQRSILPTEQDRRLGHGEYCLVRGGAAYYGGVERYLLEGESLWLFLSAEAAQALELPQSVQLDLGVEGSALVQSHIAALLM